MNWKFVVTKISLWLCCDRFEEGFKTLGLIDELKKHPYIFEDLFINAVRPLEAKDLSTLFDVDFSPLGSNKRRLENKTVCFWRDWLIDVEGSVVSALLFKHYNWFVLKMEFACRFEWLISCKVTFFSNYNFFLIYWIWYCF